MTKRSTEDMNPKSHTCPHCGADTVDYVHPGRPAIYKRCPICRCRWRSDGKHIVAGRRCPLQQAMPLSSQVG